MKALTAVAFLAAAVLATTAVAATPKTKIVGNVTTGKKLFKAQDCGSCHMMAAANAFGGSGVGPDLDTAAMTYAQMIVQITKGGHGMTGYKKVLTTAQIEDLAAFVYMTSHSK